MKAIIISITLLLNATTYTNYLTTTRKIITEQQQDYVHEILEECGLECEPEIIMQEPVKCLPFIDKILKTINKIARLIASIIPKK